MRGNISDYLLFIEDKAIAVVEAKKEDNPLGKMLKSRRRIMLLTLNLGMAGGLTILFLLSICEC